MSLVIISMYIDVLTVNIPNKVYNVKSARTKTKPTR